jgi:hypothetical protein
VSQGVPTTETEEAHWGMREIFGGGICMKFCPVFRFSDVPSLKACSRLCLRSCLFHTFAKNTAPSPLRQNHAVRPSASRKHLVAVLGELLPDLGVDGCALLGVDELLLHGPLALVVGGALDLSPLLEPMNWLVTNPVLLMISCRKRTCQQRRCTSSRTHGRDGRRSSTCGRA